MSTANIYRVGDFVYFESSSTNPFHIRRIEELNKTPAGSVEAKVMSFFRRRDLPNTLISLADSHQNALEAEGENIDRCDLSVKERHQLKHRELFLSRQIESLPAVHIRGKCSVTLLNETESLHSYLNKDDTFFYCLVYDPSAKTLLADKGEIREGNRYQTDIPALLKEGESDPRKEKMETLVWTPEHNLTDKQIDQFLVTSRSVGTFARALDYSSSVKQPSLHMSAAAASRDITLFHAMHTLHKHKYVLSEAVSALVKSGPVLCRDEMEVWSASEANLFEEALEKYGKDFNDIRQDFLPWKSVKNIIEYYYMWKTTDRYVQQKKVKAIEAESKLKQVCIPNYTKQNPSGINSNKNIINGTSDIISNKPCESCGVTSAQQWFSWGPTHLQCKLCQICWDYWKKYGGLKNPNTKFGQQLIAGKSIAELESLLHVPRKNRGSATSIGTNLGITRNHDLIVSDLASTDRDKMTKSERIAFPKPTKAPDGSLLYERVPNPKSSLSSKSLKRKLLDELQEIDAITPSKRLLTVASHFAEVNARETIVSPIQPPKRDVISGSGTGSNLGSLSGIYGEGPIDPRTVISQFNRKVKVATMSRTGRKQVISCQVPDELYYKSNKLAKKARRQLPARQLKRAARKPWRKLTAK